MAEKVRKPIYKRWWFWLIAVIIAIGVFAGSGDDVEQTSGDPKVVEDSEEKESDSKDEKKEKKKKEKKEKDLENQEFSVGEKVEFNGYIVEVTSVEKSSGNEFEKPQQGKEYVIVHVSIENNGDKEIDYNPFHFKMKNSNGQIEDHAFTIIDNDTKLSSGELAPGGNISGTVTFEQPIDDDGLQLIFEPSFWSAKQVIFNLQ